VQGTRETAPKEWQEYVDPQDEEEAGMEFAESSDEDAGEENPALKKRLNADKYDPTIKRDPGSWCRKCKCFQ
jgi:hypothetical protein